MKPRKTFQPSPRLRDLPKLQWSRGGEAAEDAVAPVVRRFATPLQWSRGGEAAEDTSSRPPATGPLTRFNGAAAVKPRKTF